MQKIITYPSVQTLTRKNLNKLKLCSDLIPWVVTGKHLGTRIENKPGNILNQDMKEKRVQYIQRNIQLGLVGFVWTGSRDDL